MRRHRMVRLPIIIMFMFALAVFFLNSAITTLQGPGIRFTTPEKTVQSYWDSISKQNLEKASLSFSGVRMIDIPLVVKAMFKTNIQINGIQILEKTILDEQHVHLKYTVFLKRGKYNTGDVLSYDEIFGWRILAPASEAPKQNYK